MTWLEVLLLVFIQGEGTQNLVLTLDSTSEEEVEHGQKIPSSNDEEEEDIVELGTFPAKYPSKLSSTSTPSTSATLPTPRPKQDVLIISSTSSSDDEIGAKAPRKASESTTVRNLVEVNTFFL